MFVLHNSCDLGNNVSHGLPKVLLWGTQEGQANGSHKCIQICLEQNNMAAPYKLDWPISSNILVKWPWTRDLTVRSPHTN